MKTTLTLLLTLALPGCMADWAETGMSAGASDATNGQDSAGGQDSKGSDTSKVAPDTGKGGADAAPDIQSADVAPDVAPAVDVAPKPACDMPTKDRLVQNPFDGTWHDKLLDLDCVFVPTEGFGKRCLPINAPYQELGNKSFPRANGVNVNNGSAWFVTPDCSFGAIVPVKPDLLGHWARFGFQPSTAQVGTVDAAFNLVDMPTQNVLAPNPISGKAQTLKGVYWHAKEDGVWSCTLGKAAPNANPPHGAGEHIGYGDSDWSLMATNGVASLPECPFLTGLDLFASMP